MCAFVRPVALLNLLISSQLKLITVEKEIIT